NDTVSEPNESLRIVSDADLDFAKYALQTRIPRKYHAQRQSEDEAMLEDVDTKASVYGATLLSGILYCAHCGHKLVGGYCTKQRGNGAYHRPIYRCYNGSVKAKGCDGQTVYSAMKIETAVLEIVRAYLQTISATMDSVWQEQARIQLRSKQQTRLKAAKSENVKLQAQQTKLQQEVMKSLMGESSFDTDLLKKMLEDNTLALIQSKSVIEECEASKESEDERIHYLSEQYRNISDWAEEFDSAGNDNKKMILARIIEKITVNRNYHLNITFFVTEGAFRQEIGIIQPDADVSEAQRQIVQMAN
ncbi:MAG: zinc ribbon domain-containing protein, partial [Clostridia bacterium]